MICGLLGRKLGHSYSPAIHGLLGDYQYRLFEKEPEELEAFLDSPEFCGINVTIPYKKAVIPYLKGISPKAKRIGSVNTIVKKADGLYGDNTDYDGFTYMVKSSGVCVKDKKVIVLGSGGASLTVCCVMEDMGAGSVTVISRTGRDNYENISKHHDADIIVNATPVGMFPHNGSSCIDLECFSRCELVLDLIYNPARTKLLSDAERLGIKYENGLGMLAAQAKRAAELFTDSVISDSVIPQITKKLADSMENIVLIGMPGCGKTSIGRALADMPGREFVDADTVFQEKTGIFPGDFITAYGEEAFRQKEHEVLKELCRLSGKIIATGGGCVTRDINYSVLRENSRVVWIRRSTRSLPTDGRPLSKASGTDELYLKRVPMYARFAHTQIKNDGSVEDAVNLIKRRLNL